MANRGPGREARDEERHLEASGRESQGPRKEPWNREKQYSVKGHLEKVRKILKGMIAARNIDNEDEAWTKGAVEVRRGWHESIAEGGRRLVAGGGRPKKTTILQEKRAGKASPVRQKWRTKKGQDREAAKD